jgi:hypothetical protein
MTGDFRDFVSKIRCVCLVDEYDNMVSVEITSPLFQQPVLTAHFEDPDADDDEAEGEGEGEDETDIKGSKGKSPNRQGKRKRGDKGASQEPDEAVSDRLVLIYAMKRCALQCSTEAQCDHICVSIHFPLSFECLSTVYSPIQPPHLHLNKITHMDSLAAWMPCRVRHSGPRGLHPL